MGTGPDGFECLQRLREGDGYDASAVPAIAFTGLVTQAIRQRCQDAGFALTLTKPFAAETLETALTELIGKAPDAAVFPTVGGGQPVYP
ncbi:response regulator [Alkalilimnicola sp. S0819]|uniref:response regulator n=1 Tax=Alkalilimnicola sp. S0819 TaxID=2613922 RepID=UPI001869B40A|nr:hypothetical protein [Alkalilimnicola sp. S0819]